tara:strand:+ start:26627 stop:28867 length:2241 start_codon:yes stop_codon:yes gene_type:complete
MNNKIISLIIFFCFIVNSIKAEVKTDSSKIHFENAFQEVKEMLEEIKPLDFQRAVFVTENAYYNNIYKYERFEELIHFHTFYINELIKTNRNDTLNFNVNVKANGRFNIDEIRHTPEQKEDLYNKTLANWAIFTYITDTTSFGSLKHLPYQYNAKDPFGMNDWKNSQVINLLISNENSGNCFALTALYKIFSNQLNSNAIICTAPQHIYIQHKNHKGDWYNVELATAGHPADGSIQTLTYTTNKALMKDISLRSLDEKQSVALCLVNLAKSYERKYEDKTDDFLLKCAELVLEHDPKNLNALLLKQQVLDTRIIKYARENKLNTIDSLRKDSKINTQLTQLEKHLSHLSQLGYIQMPVDMQEVVMNGFKGENAAQFIKKDKNPNPFASIDIPEEQNQYVDLSHGIFQEVFEPKEIETYGHFTFNTKNNKLIKIDTQMVNNQIIDPVAFAYDLGARMYDARLGRMMSTDPVMQPHQSPYLFVANNPIIYVEKNGEDNVIYLVALPSSKSDFTVQDAQAIADKANQSYKDLGLETRVVVYNSTEPFSPEHIDPTDSYVLLGSSAEITSTVKAESFSKKIQETAATLASKGPENPERSATDGTNGGSFQQGILIESTRVQNFANLTGSDKTDATAFLILHGSVHNVGFNRHEAGEPLNMDGSVVAGKLGAILQFDSRGNIVLSDPNYNSLDDFLKAEDNTTIISTLKRGDRFGNRKATDNYYFNKRNKATDGAAQPRSNPTTVDETKAN